MPKKKDHPPEVDILTNSNLPTLFADGLNIAVRGDGLILLRLVASLPEGMTEQARLMVKKDRVKAMIDLLCSNVDYYPVKPRPKKGSS